MERAVPPCFLSISDAGGNRELVIHRETKVLVLVDHRDFSLLAHKCVLVKVPMYPWVERTRNPYVSSTMGLIISLIFSSIMDFTKRPFPSDWRV